MKTSQSEHDYKAGESLVEKGRRYSLSTQLNYSQQFSGLLEAILFEDIKESSAWRHISLSH